MRKTSLQIKEHNTNSQDNRRGDNKSMKKFLSVALSTAMAFSMFANVAFGAELTTQEKFEALKAKGVLNGINGESALEQTLTRAQFAKALTTLLGLTSTTTGSAFTDVKATHWAAPSINAAAEAKLVQGVGAGKFAPNQVLTVGAVAKVLTLALKIDAGVKATDTWEVQAKAYIAAAVKAGLITEAQSTDYKGTANRGVLVDAMYTAWSAGQKLIVTTIAQTGAKKITVTFNQAVTDADKKDLTFEVKNGFVPYNVSAKYAEDNKSVVLESSFPYPAADYTVTVKGFEAKTVKVEAAKVTKLEIGAANLQKTSSQDLKIKALDQFGEEVTSAVSDANISVYNGTKGFTYTVAAGKVDLLEALKVAAIDDTVIVTATHPTTGLSATKTFKVVAESSATAITLGAVTPLKDKTRISVSESAFVLPYTLVDQYGNKITLPTTKVVSGNDASFGDLKFTTSNNAIVSPAGSFAVDADGKLTFNTLATAGTVVITAINTKTGAAASVAVKVEASPSVKTYQLSHPGVLIAESEGVKFPYASTDTFDAQILAKDFSAANQAAVNLTSSNPAVTVAKAYNSKGELTLTFTGTGTTTVYAWVNGAIASQVNIEVKAASAPVKVTGLKDLQTLFANGGSVTAELKNLNVVDTYGRAVTTLPAGYDFVIVKKDVAANKVTIAGKVVAGSANDGSETLIVKLQNAGVDVANSSYEFTATVVKAEAVVSYSLATIPTLYANKATAFASAAAAGSYAKDVTLIGKTTDGKEVAIAQGGIITSITTSNDAVVVVEGTKVFAKTAGTATVAAWKGATKLAEQVITTTDAVPVATTVEFSKEEEETTTTIDVGALLTVKDQYGVALPKTGTWTSSDNAKATVVAGVVTKVAVGEVTISFVTANGIAKTIKVTIK